MEIIGYIASVGIGAVLGLVGSGGSILTIPVLVYLFHVNAITATTYSLIIVGTTSLIGAVSYLRSNLVNVKAVLLFGIPSVVAVFIMRAYRVPAIPHNLFTIGKNIITKDMLLLLLFAVLMVIASVRMIKDSAPDIDNTDDENISSIYTGISVRGAAVGALTGTVGIGGGFLIIPALVLLARLPIREAVGTSLVIITINSWVGFMGENFTSTIDWFLISKITGFAICGILLGTALSKKIDGTKLKPAFGWFVLAMGIYIIIKETILK